MTFISYAPNLKFADKITHIYTKHKRLLYKKIVLLI